MLLVVLFAIVGICFADGNISFKKAIEIIKEKNYDVKISKLEIKKAEGLINTSKSFTKSKPIFKLYRTDFWQKYNL